MESETTHWLDPATENGTSVILLREFKKSGKDHFLEELEISFPFMILPGEVIEGCDRYHRGRQIAEIQFNDVVDGPYRVMVDATVCQCLRIVSTSSGNTDRAAEYFVDISSGTIILQREYSVMDEPVTRTKIKSFQGMEQHHKRLNCSRSRIVYYHTL